jgi:glycosyltransferase involved in cell wall biosynthesis
MEKEIDSAGQWKSKIVRLGYVADRDVNILYSNSLFFTYISQYEGFGMPPLEAMQSGTPVITSNNSSLPEVVGEAAIKIDCADEKACLKAFEDLYFKENLRKKYITKGLQRAKLFSWDKTARKIIGVIKEKVIYV